MFRNWTSCLNDTADWSSLTFRRSESKCIITMDVDSSPAELKIVTDFHLAWRAGTVNATRKTRGRAVVRMRPAPGRSPPQIHPHSPLAHGSPAAALTPHSRY